MSSSLDDLRTTISMSTRDGGYRTFVQVPRKQWRENTHFDMVGKQEHGIRLELENKVELKEMLAFINWMSDRRVEWFRDYDAALKVSKKVGNKTLEDLFTGVLLG